MRVWDFPLRLFHWALFVSIVGAIISAKMEILWVHERFGLTVLGLIVFRIFWVAIMRGFGNSLPGRKWLFRS